MRFVTGALIVLLAGCSIEDHGKTNVVECPGLATFEVKRDGRVMRDQAGRRVYIPSTCKVTVID